MTNSEFSNEFDILYNNITSNQAPGLDEYEKSVFLTKAQLELIKNYYTPIIGGNKYQQGLDDSRKRQIDFSGIISTISLSPCKFVNQLDNRSLCFRFPDDIFIPLNENLSNNNKSLVIVPLSYSEYDILMQKPYKYPYKNQVWKLQTNSNDPNAICYEYSSNGILCRICNTSNKKVIFNYSPWPEGIIEFETPLGNPPEIIETENIVNITCNVLNTVPSYKYHQKYLSNKEKLIPYIGIFGADKSPYKSSPSVFPVYTPSEKNNEGIYIVAEPITRNNKVVELIGKDLSKENFIYTIRYIRYPKPIILSDLSDGLSIEGQTRMSECELSEEIHSEILQRAVEIAKLSYLGDVSSSIESGKRSE